MHRCKPCKRDFSRSKRFLHESCINFFFAFIFASHFECEIEKSISESDIKKMSKNQIICLDIENADE